MKTIYCIKDKDENIVYVGQTANPKKRKRDHWRNRKLDNSYTFEIIEKCNDEIADAKEEYYIKYYGVCKNGWNKIPCAQVYEVKGAGILGRFAYGNKEWSARKIKRVKCIETGEIFESARKCAEIIGTRPYRVNQLCNGTKKSWHGLHFIYLDD